MTENSPTARFHVSQARNVYLAELKQIPLGRYGYGSDMAGAIMWLATPSGSYVTGQLVNINGGLDFS